ncbi:helix-turn-helix domain-containing protein [Myceligenerans salitolerans]|uniref:LysR family transcriptional regulator n=1 Tax=Myceligenerans salitolerans TaxID=1230528 RepID=A0ABS3I7Y4_9MICO|nr:LysR family transcriptional regulator [Myceligenerans salitolerans]MBO0608519.1 LysR family transcriptional regulator [Myceligenerans salitolerans]
MRSFIALIDHRTQRAAAAFLGVGRSTISDHIIALETKAGGRLFDRVNKVWRATPGGRRAEAAVRAAVHAYDAAALAIVAAPGIDDALAEEAALNTTPGSSKKVRPMPS